MEVLHTLPLLQTLLIYAQNPRTRIRELLLITKMSHVPPLDPLGTKKEAPLILQVTTPPALLQDLPQRLMCVLLLCRVWVCKVQAHNRWVGLRECLLL